MTSTTATSARPAALGVSLLVMSACGADGEGGGEGASSVTSQSPEAAP